TEISASSPTSCPGLCAGSPPIRTVPAITAAAARERDSNSPRSASRASSRFRGIAGERIPANCGDTASESVSGVTHREPKWFVICAKEALGASHNAASLLPRNRTPRGPFPFLGEGSGRKRLRHALRNALGRQPDLLAEQ